MKQKAGMVLVNTSEVYSFASEADSSNTRRAYDADWRDFAAWCSTHNYTTLPVQADKLALYLRHCAEKLGKRISTVKRRVAAISETHKRFGLPSPASEWVVKNTIKRLSQNEPKSKKSKKPLMVEDLKLMLEHLPSTLAGARDKTILLIGFCGALKRSELVSLNIEDISEAAEGVVLSFKNRKVGIPFGADVATCPVRALKHWLRTAKISAGPVFTAVTKFDRTRPTRLSARMVSEVVKKYCKIIGKREAHFSGHSLRAGLAVSASLAGASESSIQKQTGLSNLLVLRKYTGDADIFKENAVSKLRL